MSFNPHSSFHSLPRLLPFPNLEFLCMTITSVESSFGLEKRELQPLYVLSNSREWFCSEFLSVKLLYPGKQDIRSKDQVGG
ncbi:hypothetical protein P8452_71163 [Trifolium repens]|nr:hypothetical protein P8452_71163 [Trifolium repens]